MCIYAEGYVSKDGYTVVIQIWIWIQYGWNMYKYEYTIGGICRHMIHYRYKYKYTTGDKYSQVQMRVVYGSPSGGGSNSHWRRCVWGVGLLPWCRVQQGDSRREEAVPEPASPCSTFQRGGGLTICGWGECCPWRCCTPSKGIFCSEQPHWSGVRNWWCVGPFSPPSAVFCGPQQSSCHTTLRCSC